MIRVSPAGQVTDVHRFFCRLGCWPETAPVLATDGWLYGMAFGGQDEFGVIYCVRPDGSLYEKLFNFVRHSKQGSSPRDGLFQARDGYIYGRTADEGTIFRVAPPP